jgi:transcriptional regulator with XRE-family HTH domain
MVVRDSRELGALLRRRRKAVGLTATQAAAMAGLSRRLLSELERGKRRNVGIRAVFAIAELLGLSLAVEARGLPGVRDPNRSGARV